MTKQRGKIRPRHGTSGSSQTLSLVTLAGVVVLLMMSFSNWREIDKIQESLDSRFTKMDGRMDEIAAKVDRPPARRGGLDPNKVYPIKVAENAPAKGPANAVVTVAEFSDFQ